MDRQRWEGQLSIYRFREWETGRKGGSEISYHYPVGAMEKESSWLAEIEVEVVGGRFGGRWMDR